MKFIKVTDRYQVTIPKEIRKRVGLKPGMIVRVELRGEREIVITVPEKIENPLEILIGKRPLLDRHLPIEELEELVES